VVIEISAGRAAALAAFFALLLMGRPADAGAFDDAYLLQPGDVLDVSVWREETLQKQVAVRPDGAITFPLVDSVQAQGRTVAQVTKAITDRLAQYIPGPVVTVTLVQNAGNRIYVLGRVNKPGELVMIRPTDVVQALSMAGGRTPFADRKNIRVLRREDGGQRSIPFNYSQVEEGESLEQNIVLKAGDAVMVP
jgi:polysaccharide export outer membrane protein